MDNSTQEKYSGGHLYCVRQQQGYPSKKTTLCNNVRSRSKTFILWKQLYTFTSGSEDTGRLHSGTIFSLAAPQQTAKTTPTTASLIIIFHLVISFTMGASIVDARHQPHTLTPWRRLLICRLPTLVAWMLHDLVFTTYTGGQKIYATGRSMVSSSIVPWRRSYQSMMCSSVLDWSGPSTVMMVLCASTRPTTGDRLFFMRFLYI